MFLVVIGITHGTVIGLIGNWLLFRKMDSNRNSGQEPLKGIGLVFFIRYMIDAFALFLFGYIVKDPWPIIAAGFSLTVAVKISLFIAYARKGGKFG